MKQLDLFPETLNWPNDFDGAHQVGGVNQKIYESPDKGKTVYARDFGSDPSTRVLVKSAAEQEQQWNITFGSPNGA